MGVQGYSVYTVTQFLQKRAKYLMVLCKKFQKFACFITYLPDAVPKMQPTHQITCIHRICKNTEDKSSDLVPLVT
jgi:hypothetical protein